MSSCSFRTSFGSPDLTNAGWTLKVETPNSAIPPTYSREAANPTRRYASHRPRAEIKVAEMIQSQAIAVSIGIFSTLLDLLVGAPRLDEAGLLLKYPSPSFPDAGLGARADFLVS